MKFWGNILLLFAAIFLFAGCVAPQTPAVTPIAQATPASLPTLQPAPTPSASDDAEPPLRTSGPYLAYLRQMGDKQQLVLMDADGLGRRIISIPTANYLDARFVSPDAKWLAYYSGTAGAGRTSDLTLNLLDLQTGETRLVSKLLSKDYPDNFTRAAKGLDQRTVTPEQLQLAFLAGIGNSLAWSPDGRFLAFAGEMDGPSSDLYLYDMATKTIQRKSSGPSEVEWIGWSPDGQWIVYSSVYAVGEGMTFEIYSSSPTGETTNDLISSSGASTAPTQWVNDHQFLDNDSSNGLGDYGLRLIDVAGGSKLKVWPGNFHNLIMDNQKEWVAFASEIPTWPYHGEDPTFIPGLYIVNLTNLTQGKLATPPEGTQAGYTLVSSGLEDQEFIATGGNGAHLLFASVNGTLTDSGIAAGVVSLSPDLQAWVVINSRISVYASSNKLIHQLPFSNALAILGPSQILWRPDSSGLFLTEGTSLFAVDFHNNRIQPVENNLVQPPTFAWVGQK